MERRVCGSISPSGVRPSASLLGLLATTALHGKQQSARDTAQAMSEENIEMVRRLVDAWNRRDIEALLDLGGPEIAFVNSPTAVEPGTRARDG